jgi:hypothetical protein
MDYRERNGFQELKAGIVRKQMFGIGGNIAIHEFIIINVLQQLQL